MNDDRGHSLAEILVALTIFMVGSAAAVPALKAYIVDSKLVGAALIFKGTFRRARSIAVRSGAQTAIRFEERADGIYFALYSDGNYNTTWGVALSDGAALALVPATASAGPVAVSRRGLRSNSAWFGGPSDETPTRVVRIDPCDGATGVFKDTPVVARLSQPADPSTLSPRTFRVLDEAGEVPARVRLSRDGSVVIWQAERLLQADSQHVVTCSGLEDRRGREVSPHLSRFLVCDLARADLGT